MSDDKVKRYREPKCAECSESLDGDYVKHEDYAKMEENLLESEKRHAVEIKINNQLEAEIGVLKGKLTVYMSNDVLVAENAKLKVLMEKTKVLIESCHSLNDESNIRAVEAAIDALEEGK